MARTPSMPTTALYAVDALLAALGLFLFRRLIRLVRSRVHARKTSISRLPLPPSPPGLPLLGNILAIPTGHAWLGYSALSSYGPLVRLSVPLANTHIVVLHSLQAAKDLFASKDNGAVFNDRPRIVFGGEMCGWEHTLALQRYGAHMKIFRKEVHQVRPCALS